MSCVFCAIVAGQTPASVVYEDDGVLGFMTRRPTAPGECLLIPKAHVDHFTDVDESLAAQLMRVAMRLARRLRAEFPCERVGFLVHGYGVAHAHLILVPQQGPNHLTSDRFARIVDDRIVFTIDHLEPRTRPQLDEDARRLRIAPLS